MPDHGMTAKFQGNAEKEARFGAGGLSEGGAWGVHGSSPQRRGGCSAEPDSAPDSVEAAARSPEENGVSGWGWGRAAGLSPRDDG